MTINGRTTTISDMMRPPVTVGLGLTLKEVLEKMIHERRNSLTVVDGQGKFVGAVSALEIIKEVVPDYIEESDTVATYANEELFREDALRVANVPIEKFMVKDIPTITVDGSLVKAAVLATQYGRGRITVVDSEHKPVGVLTRTELKRVIGSFLDIRDRQ